MINHFSAGRSFPRSGGRAGLHIDLFKACSAFTRVAVCDFGDDAVGLMRSICGNRDGISGADLKDAGPLDTGELIDLVMVTPP
jgi:hypothetical protein